MRYLTTLAALLLTTLFVAGCENDGPAEEAGEALDNAAEDIRDGGESFGESVEDAAEEVEDEIEDARRS